MADDTEEVVEDTPFSQILANKVEDDTDVKPAEAAETSSDSKDQKPDDKDAKPADKVEPSKDDKPKDQGEDALASVKEELKGIKKALKSEREKRQSSEAEQREVPEKTSWDEDPDRALEERLAEQAQATENRFYVMCENLVKAEHEDFDEVVGVFMEEAEDDKVLAQSVFQQMSAQANPAQYLYNFAKNRSETKEFGGDLSKYKDSIQEPLNVKVKELEKANKELTEQLESLGKVSPSLNSESSATTAQVDADAANEDTSIDDIVKQRHDMRKTS